MKNSWNEDTAQEYVDRFREWGPELALRTYSARLIGSEPSLVLHGGGNTSVKWRGSDHLGREHQLMGVKASGFDLATIGPEGHPPLELEPLQELKRQETLSDEEMVREIRRNLLDYRSPNPSIETLVHAFVPAPFVDHTHSDAILTLSNQQEGRRLLTDALGDEVIVIDYYEPGFELARATYRALVEEPEKTAVVWLLHGLLTWGETARASYDHHIELVTRAEEFIAKHSQPRIQVSASVSREDAVRQWEELAPSIRGALAEPQSNPDHPFRPVITVALQEEEVLYRIGSDLVEYFAETPPVTSDHLIRTKPYPLLLKDPPLHSPAELRKKLEKAVEDYREKYGKYLKRYGGAENLPDRSLSPRVVFLHGLGAICAGPDIREALIARDITRQTLQIKTAIAGLGTYRGLDEDQLFEMEHRAIQTAKLNPEISLLTRKVALVTGAAGAIGLGISKALLRAGCHVVLTDLEGDPLAEAVEELEQQFPLHVLGVPLDVTDPESVKAGIRRVAARWGGIDLFVVNAGVAHVASLASMELKDFQRLEKVNVEGTLLILSEAARLFTLQGTGGDVVLISTKNVFSPGARFGAYSATKAASHQLARIASLELADLGVRVNMVAPDAVFSEGAVKSGLWEEVGPDRMKARGLDEKELQEYYRSRNLLKARITAEHVARAVLYFARRETPTTGATIPVDGGLPDATPR